MSGLQEPTSGRENGAWQTAETEVSDLRRWLSASTEAAERLATELAHLRGAALMEAREEVARGLLAGSDGSALALLVSYIAGVSPPIDTRRVAELLLERLSRTLDLHPVGRVGDQLRLSLDELRDYEVLNLLPSDDPADGEEYTVVRSGWRIGERIIARPVVDRAQIC